MTPCELVAGTADGIRCISVDETGHPEITAFGLSGQAIRGIATHPGDPEVLFAAAGLRGWGLHQSKDRGETWASLGFDDYWCWDVAIDTENPDRMLLGTEPPMLWESTNSGETWHDFPGINEVKSRKHWTFFHAPFHAGHLHGIAITPHGPDRIIVGVEHGGLLLSQDGGRNWRDVMPGADMHRVVIDPADPDRIYAGAGNGLFLSTDGGECWTAFESLRGRYVHGIVIDPGDPERIFVYVDSHHSPIHRTLDGGETWEPVGIGLPPSRPADPIRLHPVEPSTLFYTGDQSEGSTLYTSEDDGETWHCSELTLPKVWRLAALER